MRCAPRFPEVSSVITEAATVHRAVRVSDGLIPCVRSALSFTAYSVALGLSYAYCARQTGSIRWCTVSHCIHDALGLGAFAFSSWLT